MELTTAQLNLELQVHEYSWELLVRDPQGGVGVAAFGPIGSLPLMQHVFQAGGAIRKQGPTPPNGKKTPRLVIPPK